MSIGSTANNITPGLPSPGVLDVACRASGLTSLETLLETPGRPRVGKAPADTAQRQRVREERRPLLHGRWSRENRVQESALLPRRTRHTASVLLPV